MLPRALPCPALLILLLVGLLLAFNGQPSCANDADGIFQRYFDAETAKLERASLVDVKSLDEWNRTKDARRRELLDMLGLDPLPKRTDLQQTITGTIERDGVTVEKLHFQSSPGLYVTGNLYRPSGRTDEQLPAVLYVCGHGEVKKNGVAYGNKVYYQQHGDWLARHGYVCLVIDSLQLGEIEGIHHGTYRYDRWWWLSRGYTPAGVEAWNCIRALDYLQSRPDVDGKRIGVTGRSGGGAYSWWIAAIDDRIQCAVPTAGIADLRNHVVDKCVDGHCDCMYMLNTYRWDYPQVAALVAPRPLLIANTDADPIFPLDGVTRTFFKVREVYKLHDKQPLLGLNITTGGHVDTQELQVTALRWLDVHLKGKAEPITDVATARYTPEELKVFAELPADQRNTRVDETFVPPAPTAPIPEDAAAWKTMSEAWRAALLEKSFRAWPEASQNRRPPRRATAYRAEGVTAVDVVAVGQPGTAVPLFVVHKLDLPRAGRVELHVLDQSDLEELQACNPHAFQSFGPKREIDRKTDWDAWKRIGNDPRTTDTLHVFVTPRGVGRTKPQTLTPTQLRRRFYLLGQTLEGMQAFDVRSALQAIRAGLPDVPAVEDAPIEIKAHGPMAGVALYASLFEPAVDQLTLTDLPRSHNDGPHFLNVLRTLDMPQAVAMASERSKVVLKQKNKAGWDYPQAVAEKLSWQDRLQIIETNDQKEPRTK